MQCLGKFWLGKSWDLSVSKWPPPLSWEPTWLRLGKCYLPHLGIGLLYSWSHLWASIKLLDVNEVAIIIIIFGEPQHPNFVMIIASGLHIRNYQNNLENVRFTTPIQQLYNNSSHEGGPHTLGPTLMWGVVVQLLWWCSVRIKSLIILGKPQHPIF
jgi:hypothetical protein